MDSVPLAASDPVPSAAAAARFFRVLGDPTRLAILELLLAGPRTVSELTAAAGVPRARVSNHLACLRWCGFAEAERHGRQMIYRAADPRLAVLLAAARPLIADRADHLASCRRIGPDWI
jgi:ArsR family transcriptional regulator, cadmium/lead-responsive transcriptional repressor